MTDPQAPPPDVADLVRRDLREEAKKVTVNLNGDHREIARYAVERCGDFIYDHQRIDFIAELLREAADALALKASPELKDVIQVDGGLYSLGWYLCWDIGDDTATLDGTFTADDLTAIANHMRGHLPLPDDPPAENA